MTITSITKLPSGKTGATITSNLDELAIMRGLVVNALRHMPDVGETTSTRQRLKAMSRALHRVYTQEKPRVWVGTSWITSPATLEAEQEGNTRAQVKNAVECLKTAGCNSILSGMPDRFTYQEFADRVTAAGIASDLNAREILVSLLNESKEWMADHVERVVKRVGVVHRRPLKTIMDGMPKPFTRTQFIDEALDHGHTVDEATKWLSGWLEQTTNHDLDAKTDTVHRRGLRPQTLIPKYGGTPVVCGPTVLPLSDQKSLMEILSDMPGEFTFSQFYNRVLHALKAVNAAMHGAVTKQGEEKLREECDTFLMNLPRNVFEIDGVFQSVKRKGSVAVIDQKSIPNPDYVSPPTAPNVPVPPPAGATTPPTVRTTLFEVYDKMDKYFTFGTLSNRAAEYGHDRPKVSSFVSLMCKFGSLRQMGSSSVSSDDHPYEKLSSVTSPEMRHIASLIA